MRPKLRLWTIALCLLAAPAAAQNATTVELARLPSFTEGVVVDDAGNIYVSEPFGRNISRITTDGEVSVWASTPAPNGHKILADGTHLICDGGDDAILRLTRDGKRLEPAATACDGRPLENPNDLTLDSMGGFYFTDSGADLVCYVGPGGRSRIVTDTAPVANGIALSADGRRLFVSLFQLNQIVEFAVVEPGVVGERRVFAERGSDGMALDAEGNLYVTGVDGVAVLDGAGKLVKQYSVQMGFASNVAFAGPELSQLLITGSFHPIDLEQPLAPQMGSETGNYGLLLRVAPR